MLKEETACLTGHRPKSLPWGYDEEKESCKKFKKDLFAIFTGAIEYGLKTYLIGMAEGFDMIGGETLIDFSFLFPLKSIPFNFFKELRLISESFALIAER